MASNLDVPKSNNQKKRRGDSAEMVAPLSDRPLKQEFPSKVHRRSPNQKRRRENFQAASLQKNTPKRIKNEPSSMKSSSSTPKDKNAKLRPDVIEILSSDDELDQQDNVSDSDDNIKTNVDNNNNSKAAKRKDVEKKESSSEKRQKLGDLNINSEPTKETITFTPDPSLFQAGTWREEEILGHNSLAYPCGELVDNSLMATDSNADARIIDIYIVKQSEKEFHLVFHDNGCGMNKKGVNDLATYSLAPKDRHGPCEVIADTSHTVYKRYVNSNISKFGVGLKNAAFHIGDDMTVITKKKDMLKVLEFNLNMQKMRERSNKGLNPYEGQIMKRCVGRIGESILSRHQKQSPQIQKLIKEEVQHPTFTSIVISKIKEEHVPRLSEAENRHKLAMDLTEIYHYYLHGPFGKSSSKSSQMQFDDGVKHAQISLHYCDDSQKVESVLNIVTCLNNITEDIQSRNHLKQRGPSFQFHLKVPNRGIVVGEVFYYPFINDQETIPPFRRSKYSGETNGALEMSGASPDTAVELDAGDEKMDETPQTQWRSDGHIFMCMWQGRLIPFTTVRILPFMMDKTIPIQLIRRVRGMLFCNESFPVNPQKIIFTDDLGEILSDPAVEVINIRDHIPLEEDKSGGFRKSARIRNIAAQKAHPPHKRFKNWVIAMSKEHDLEISYSDTTRKGAGVEEHRRALYGGRIFKTGDLIQLERKQSETAAFGTVNHFTTQRGQDGTTSILRLPEKIYGSELTTVPTRLLLKHKPMDRIEADFKKEEQKLMADYPMALDFDFETNLFEDGPPKKNVLAGYSFPDAYIRILGHPDKDGRQKRLCDVRLYDHKRKKKLVVLQRLEIYNHDEERWVPHHRVNAKGDFVCPVLEKKYDTQYYFNPFKLDVIGKCRMIYSVSLKDCKNENERIQKEMIKHMFDLRVSAGPPERLCIPPDVHELLLGHVCSEEILLELKDEYGNVIDNHVNFQPKVSIASDMFDVSGDVDYSVQKRQFTLVNVKASPLIDEKGDNKSLAVEGVQAVAVIMISFDPKTPDDYLDAEMNIHVSPGPPSRLLLLDDAIPDKIENQSKLPSFSVQTLDAFGNVTTTTEYVFKFDIDRHDIMLNPLSQNLTRIKGEPTKWNFEQMVVVVRPEEFQKGDSADVVIYAEICAFDLDGERVVKIKPIKKTITVIPSKLPHYLYLVKKTERGEEKFDLDDEDTVQLNVNRTGRMYLRFLDEGKKSVAVSFDRIGEFNVRALSHENTQLMQDEASDLYFEIDIPKKVSLSPHCSVECTVKCEKVAKSLRYDFVVSPIYEDPHAWDIEFEERFASGSDVGELLQVFLLDQYGNRVPPQNFDHPLASNPQVESSCEKIGPWKCTVIGNNPYFSFLNSSLHGQSRTHTLKVSRSEKWPILASKTVEFTMISGKPTRLQCDVKRSCPHQIPGESVQIPKLYTRDVVSVEFKLVDDHHNVVQGENHNIKMKSEGTVKPIMMQIELSDGVARCDGIRLDTDLSGVEKQKNVCLNIELVGRLQIEPVQIRLEAVPTPGRMKRTTLFCDDQARMKADDYFPVIKCKLELDDGGTWTDALTCFDLEVSDPHNNEIEGIYVVEPIVSGQFLIFTPKSGRKFEKIGRFTWRLYYHEERERLVYLLPESEQAMNSPPLHRTVTPGYPAALYIRNREDLSNLHATNCGGEEKRRIVQSININVCDEYGNRTSVDEYDCLRNVAVAIKVTDMEFESDDEYPQIEYMRSTEGYNFKDINILDNSDGDEGIYNLTFYPVHMQEGEQCPMELERCHIKFTFSNDSDLLNKYQSKNREKQNLEDGISAINTKIAPIEKLRSELHRLTNNVQNLKLDSEYFEMKTRNEALTRIDAEILTLDTQINSKSLLLHLKPNGEYKNEDGYICRLGELCAVSTRRLCRVVSYILGLNANAHITRDSYCPAAHKLDNCARDVRVMALDQVASKMRSEFREFPHIRAKINVRNSPNYLIDMLQQHYMDEHIRENTFKSIMIELIGHTLVMNSREDAIQYRAAVIKRNISCPQILTLDGYVVKMVRYAVPSYDSLKRALQTVCVQPLDLIEEKKKLSYTIRPRIRKYFRACVQTDKLQREFEASREAYAQLEGSKATLQAQLETLEEELLSFSVSPRKRSSRQGHSSYISIKEDSQ